MFWLFFFKQKTAYEMRISDWSSDVCSSDLHHRRIDRGQRAIGVLRKVLMPRRVEQVEGDSVLLERHHRRRHRNPALLLDLHPVGTRAPVRAARLDLARSEEHTSELQSLMRISYDVFCVKKKHLLNHRNTDIKMTTHTNQQ